MAKGKDKPKSKDSVKKSSNKKSKKGKWNEGEISPSLLLLKGW